MTLLFIYRCETTDDSPIHDVSAGGNGIDRVFVIELKKEAALIPKIAIPKVGGIFVMASSLVLVFHF